MSGMQITMKTNAGGCAQHRRQNVRTFREPAMRTGLRKTGITTVGDMPWGTHFCHFYQTKQDLLDILVPYFKAGLENNEFCMWVISKPLTKVEATSALRQAVPDLGRHLGKRSIEFVA